MPSDLDHLRAALDAPAPPADAPVERDMPCQGCGYNLRGVAGNAVCPECGAPASASQHGDRLAWANPDWLMTVRRGLLLMSAGIALFIPLLMLTGLVAGMVPMPMWLAIGFVLSVPILCGGLLSFGAFRMTAPEPRLTLDEAPVTLRRLIRAASLLTGLAVLAYVTMVFAPELSPERRRRWDPWIERGLRYGLLFIPLLLYGTLVHLRQFARRIPDAALAASTRIVIIGLPLSAVALIVLPAETPRDGYELIRWLIYIVTGLFSMWTIGLVWLYSGALESPAHAARRNAGRSRA